MAKHLKHIYEFGPFRLDVGERLLLREGEAVPLTPKSFDLLLVLVTQRGHLLEKEELMKAVWPDSFVEENNLADNIFKLRKALVGGGEGRNEQQYIETVPKRGYRFVAPVREEAVEPGQAPGAQSPVTAQAEAVAARVAKESGRGLGRLWKQRPGLALLLVVLLLIGATGAMSLWRLERQPRAANEAIPSFAVLPFKSINRSQEDEYLGFGIADSVITRLSSTGKIIVRPTGAVSKYTNLMIDPLAAGREQQVEAVLDASLWRLGEKLRVTARLLRVSDQRPLWTYQCEEFCTDVFAVQSLISEQVAEALVIHLSGAERRRLAKRYTQNAEAYQAYAKGPLFLGQEN